MNVRLLYLVRNDELRLVLWIGIRTNVWWEIWMDNMTEDRIHLPSPQDIIIIFCPTQTAAFTGTLRIISERDVSVSGNPQTYVVFMRVGGQGVGGWDHFMWKRWVASFPEEGRGLAVCGVTSVSRSCVRRVRERCKLNQRREKRNIENWKGFREWSGLST